eukprot:1190042-Prorocentrum_minimum.AAC.1
MPVAGTNHERGERTFRRARTACLRPIALASLAPPVRLAQRPLPLRRARAPLRPTPAIGARAEYIPPSLLRLVLAPSMFRVPSCDWFSRRVHSAFPPAIGSRAEYIPPSLLRLVLAPSVLDGRESGAHRFPPPCTMQLSERPLASFAHPFEQHRRPAELAADDSPVEYLRGRENQSQEGRRNILSARRPR